MLGEEIQRLAWWRYCEDANLPGESAKGLVTCHTFEVSRVWFALGNTGRPALL
jgi:hypothetical protein